MDITIIENIFRLIIMMEFALIALAGVAALFHVIMIDAELRTMAVEQQAMLDGMSDAAEAKIVVSQQKRQARLDSAATGH
ncbi:hypothetical protein MNBD_NITROSPINAE02-978 [hydrothermal vent metagenome]|uniref:Uncharacterized protein n=1 Tax=hydrothermal vent metagenome TaxID=652676 RepID=A0A3B1CUI9_9ZZZZ